MSPNREPSNDNDTPIPDAELEARIAELDLVAEFIEAGQTWSEATPDGTIITMDADKYRALMELSETKQAGQGLFDKSDTTAVIDEQARADRDLSEDC